MDVQILLITIGYIISTFFCLLLAGIVWRRRENPGSSYFVLMMVNFALWSIASLFGLFSARLETIIFWYIAALVAQTFVGPMMFSFVTHFRKLEEWTNRPFSWLIWIIPIITCSFVFTNKFHGLAFSDVTIETLGTQMVGVFQSGPIIYINLFYSYCLVITGLYLLFQYFIQLGKSGLVSAILIIAASLLTMIIKLLQLINVSYLPHIEITPYTFSPLAFFLFWSINRQQLFSVKPVAYQTLLNNIPEGVIVIDNNDVIIKVNEIACEFIGQSENIIGESVHELAPFLCDDDPHCYEDQEQIESEIELPGSPPRIIKVQMQQIIQKNKKSVGRIFTLQDITTLRLTEEELKRKYAFTDTLVDVTADINASLELKTVLDRILENAEKVVPYDEADIVMIGEDGKYNFVSVRSNIGNHPMDFVLDFDPLNENLYGFEKMVQTGETILINNIKDNPNWNPSIKGAEWIQSYLGAPIKHREQIIGFINFARGTSNAFTEEHARHIQIFANYAASAISNAKYFNNTQRFALEMAALNEISQTVNEGTRLEEIIKAALRQLKTIIPIDVFGITLYEKQSHIVEAYLFNGDEIRINIPHFNLYTRESVSRYVIEKEKKLYIPNVFADDSNIDTKAISWIDDFRSFTLLATPLVRRSDIFGVLIVGSAKIDAYDSMQIDLVETIALQSSAAIDNARLFEQVQQQAITDTLTNLYNRRHFNDVMEREIERARRYDHNLSLIMIDIDDFKAVNDRYGHLAGDFLLKEMARLTKECLRKTDAAFRYGGEEFIYLLPETYVNEAADVAERMRGKIEDTQFIFNEIMLNITISVGVCDFSDKSSNQDDLINLVDKALYKAKASGKNCIRSCVR